MKKLVKYFLFFFCGIIIGFLLSYLWINLKGSKPAFGPVSEKIAKTENLTDLPLKIPDGFSLSVFAKGLGSPRVLAFDKNGVLLVSIPAQGKVVALADKNNDGIIDMVYDVVTQLNQPHGLAFLPSDNTKLYIAETNAVAVYSYDAQNFKAQNRRKIIDLPEGGGHSTRTIMFLTESSDEKLLISVGSSCNVCNESDWRRAKILIAEKDGSGLKEYARGLRNSVFMTNRPNTNEVWVTEMGRDLIGDDLPPEEVNIIKEGKDYGWPFCFSKNILDTTFDKKASCVGKEVPKIEMQAHSAPLGLAFVPQGWPEKYANDLLVSFHGSWNRSTPTGYKIVRMKLNERGDFEAQEDFISGFLEGSTALGRPVDIVFDKKGQAYISDDKAGVIYLLKYNG